MVFRIYLGGNMKYTILSEDQYQEDMYILTQEIIESNKHYSEYKTRCRLPKRYKVLRFDSLYRISKLLGYGFCESDLQYFVESQN